MRRILICTKAVNTVYSENYGKFLSKTIGTHFQNMLDAISQELEGLVSILKDLQLEEILVGRLQNYGFDYLFYNKGMGIVDKLFWTEKEMEELLSGKKELARKYKETFELFNKKEENKRERDEDEDEDESD